MDKLRRKLTFGDKYVLPTITFLSGIAISAVAVWYSVAGLVAIFAASAFAITVMGVALEVGKLVTAVWLHRYWEYANKWLKYYLCAGVIILMFITSMGIFGFLSKAHIEQTALSEEQVAQIETLNAKEQRSTNKMVRWSEEIARLMKGEDVRVDNLIVREQNALKELYAQIELEKDSVRKDADKQIEQQNVRLKQAQDRKEADIKAAKDRFEGSTFGGSQYDEAVEKAKNREIGVASSAQREIRNINARLNTRISEIDANYKPNVDTINNRIQKLRTQANVKTEDIDARVAELEDFIEQEQVVLDDIREDKMAYETEYRKLEAEVGPIKYVAQFLYGNIEDKNVLEQAVRWVIIIIIFVFDPLAVGLLIASQMAFQFGTPQERQEGQWKPKPPPPPPPAPKKKKPEPEPEPDPEPEPPKPKPKRRPVKRTVVKKEEGSATKGKPEEAPKKPPQRKKPKAKVVEFKKPVPKKEVTDFVPTSKVFKFKSDKPGKVETTDTEIKIMPDNEEPIKIPIREVPPAPKPKKKDNVVTLKAKPKLRPVEKDTTWQRPSYTDVIETPTLPPKQEPEPTVEESKPVIVADPKQITLAEHVESYTEETPEKKEYKESQKRIWKAINPKETLKPHKVKVKAGYINELPWEQLVLPTMDDLPDLEGRADFGVKWPTKPKKGDTFLRVDNLPHTLYKWNGKKWINVDKEQNSSYAINNQYLEHLIAQISNGEYDPDLLSDKERDELTEYLKKEQEGKNG